MGKLQKYNILRGWIKWSGLCDHVTLSCHPKNKWFRLIKKNICQWILKSALTLVRRLSLSYTATGYFLQSSRGDPGCAGGGGAESGKGEEGFSPKVEGLDLGLRFSHLLQLQAQNRKVGIKLKIQILWLVSYFQPNPPAAPRPFLPLLDPPRFLPCSQVQTLEKEVNT